MEAKSFFSQYTHFKLILHSIRNLCKFAEPFAIQYAAIITDGYSSDCFQLIFFYPRLEFAEVEEQTYHIRFILHYTLHSSVAVK